MRVIGVDISLWQNLPVGNPDRKEIDFGIMKLNADFAIFRAGQHTWRDREFANYRKQARAVGLPHGSYWFYDSRATPKAQADLWLDILDGDYGELGLWADFEDRYGGAWGRWQDWQDFILRIQAQAPNVRMGVYTAYYYWMERTAGMSPAAADWWRKFPLWVANYGVSNPLVPKPWGDWTIWQFTEKGDARTFGVYDSKNIDVNYFNGTREELYQFFDIGGNPPPPQGGITVRMGHQ
jgi:lysozyme